MKKNNVIKLTCIILLLSPILSFSQVLVETLDGDEVALNLSQFSSSTIITNLNSSEQSVQFKSLIALPNPNGVKPVSFFLFGVKGKPSDGIASLFSGGKINANANINASFTKVNLFSNIATNFTDFFSIRADYNASQCTLFNKDTSFGYQVKNFNFQGGALTFNYNLLLSGKHLLSLNVGYARKNNYSKLDAVEINDYQTIIDSSSNTTREYGKVINGKMGNYKELDKFPLRIAYIYCPSENIADANKLKPGCSFYYSSEFGKVIPSHNLGFILLLTKANQTSGIRTPILSFGIQANDISDNQNTGNPINKRLSINVATTFNIANF